MRRVIAALLGIALAAASVGGAPARTRAAERGPRLRGPDVAAELVAEVGERPVTAVATRTIVPARPRTFAEPAASHRRARAADRRHRLEPRRRFHRKVPGARRAAATDDAH